MDDPKFAHLRIMDLRRATSAGHKTTGSQLKCQLKEAVDFPAAALAVREALVAQLAQLTGLEATDVDITKPIHAHGVDSIVAVDLRTWARREVEAEIPALDILVAMPLEELAGRTARLSELVTVSDEKEGSWCGIVIISAPGKYISQHDVKIRWLLYQICRITIQQGTVSGQWYG